MKDLLIGIATLIVALIIIGTLILGNGNGTLQTVMSNKVTEGIESVQNLEFKTNP